MIPPRISPYVAESAKLEADRLLKTAAARQLSRDYPGVFRVYRVAGRHVIRRDRETPGRGWIAAYRGGSIVL